MNISTLKKPLFQNFPAASIEATLRTWLLQSILSTASLHGVSIPSEETAQSTLGIQIDSLVVVALLCEAEKIAGITLKESIVKAGGYDSVNDALAHLMPRIEKAWNRHHKGTRR